jgi:hypothetical protein
VPTLDRAVHALIVAARAHLDAGERAAATRLALRVLELDDAHPGANNIVGTTHLLRGSDASAVERFRTAIDGGGARLRWDGDSLPWAPVENRDYLEAHANLAHALTLAGEHDQALALLERASAWCPGCPLGLAARRVEAMLRLGLVERAAGVSDGDPADAGWRLTRALSRWAVADPVGASLEMVVAIGLNGCLAPVILTEDMLGVEDGPDGVRQALDALEYARKTSDLWGGDDGAAEWLAAIWFADETRAWRRAIDAALVEGDVARLRALRSPARVQAVLDALRDREFGTQVGAWRAWAGLDPTGGSYVDADHRQIPDGADVPRNLRVLIAYERRIAEAASAWGLPMRLDTPIRCRRRPGRKPCPGHLAVRSLSAGVLWGCTRCPDWGLISGLQGTPWDRSAPDPGAATTLIDVPPDVYGALLDLDPPEVRRPALRARRRFELVTLIGSTAELRALADAATSAGRIDLALPLLGAIGDEVVVEC